VAGAASSSANKKVISCFKCGGPHYKNECPQNAGPALFAQRDIVDDNSENEGSAQGAKNRAGTIAPSEQLREAHEEEEAAHEEEEAVYTSEGGYTLQEYSDYAVSDNDERCGYIAASQEQSDDDYPNLLTDDSDAETEYSDIEPDSDLPMTKVSKKDEKKSRAKEMT
jgi:hypothetical protein